MPVKMQLSFFKPLWFFLSIFISTYQLFNQNKGLFWVSHFSPYNEENEHSDSLQKTACTFEGVIAVILKQGVIITQWRDLKLYQF